MTTEHSMHRHAFNPIALALGLLAALLLQTGCATTESALRAPAHRVAPYDTRDGDVLWAVAPPANESGTTAVPIDRVADAIVAASEQARGLSAVPFDRTLAAMRALGLEAIRTPADARALGGALGVDGVIVSSVTAWDPYDPPTIGLSLALFLQNTNTPISLDVRSLVSQGSEAPGIGVGSQETGPAAVNSRYLDAQNHEVLMAVRRFAEGRSDERGALGWRLYTASMELFTEFAAHEMVGGLLRDETLRLARASRNTTER